MTLFFLVASIVKQDFDNVGNRLVAFFKLFGV
jgi:hypothetical protein